MKTVITHWLIDRKQNSTIDQIHPITGLGVWSGETLEQVRERYPDAEIVDSAEFDRFREEKRQRFITEPVAVTEEYWNDRINVLPPIRWRGFLYAGYPCSTFMMSEFMYADITEILVKINARYFSFYDSANLTAAQIIEKVIAATTKKEEVGK